MSWYNEITFHGGVTFRSSVGLRIEHRDGSSQYDGVLKCTRRRPSFSTMITGYLLLSLVSTRSLLLAEDVFLIVEYSAAKAEFRLRFTS
jgi:hypothetical protein